MESAPGEAEGLSELDHGLQCAYELSRVRPDDVELQVAGLVHDIGHQFASDEQHGAAGGERVRSLLGDRVAVLVEMHVPAKRYLVTTDPDYMSALTGVSIESLGAQGGPLSPEECRVVRVVCVCGRRGVASPGGRCGQGRRDAASHRSTTGCRC